MDFVENVLYIIFSILSYLFAIFLEFVGFAINTVKGLKWNDNVLSLEVQKTFFTLSLYIDYPLRSMLQPTWACVANIANIFLWTSPHSVLTRPDTKKIVGAYPRNLMDIVSRMLNDSLLPLRSDIRQHGGEQLLIHPFMALKGSECEWA